MEGNTSPDVHTDNFPFEDIFYSTKSNGEWSYATNIGPAINTVSHDSNLGLSKDGIKLFVYNSDVNNGDIFESTLKADGSWSEPRRLHEPVNSEYNENGASLSEDGSHLFFSSDRPGGSGSHDIYVSERNSSGGWKRPHNLGPIINTEFNEEDPFIGFDNKTLYFSSQGGRGMGGHDIFKSDYDSLSGSWGIPQNLGFPINTPDEDVHFSPTKDGFRAYYATTRDDGLGFTDIYEITFIDIKEEILDIVESDPEPEPIELQPVTVIVRVIDDETGEVVDTRVKMQVIESGEILFPSESGIAFEFTLDHDQQREYMISIEKEGFAFYNNKMTFPGAGTEAIILERTIRLKKLVTGFSKVLQNIYFDYDKTVLKDASFSELNKLEKMMSENTGMQIGIVGHTDVVGTEKYNQDLSVRRALAVKDFLVNKGIDTRRIKTGGLGAMFPLASNDDEEEGRELNRRVEMVVLSK